MPEPVVTQWLLLGSRLARVLEQALGTCSRRTDDERTPDPHHRSRRPVRRGSVDRRHRCRAASLPRPAPGRTEGTGDPDAPPVPPLRLLTVFQPLIGIAFGRRSLQDIAALTLARDLHHVRDAQRSGACSPRLPGVAPSTLVTRRSGRPVPLGAGQGGHNGGRSLGTSAPARSAT